VVSIQTLFHDENHPKMQRMHDEDEQRDRGSLLYRCCWKKELYPCLQQSLAVVLRKTLFLSVFTAGCLGMSYGMYYTYVAVDREWQAILTVVLGLVIAVPAWVLVLTICVMPRCIPFQNSRHYMDDERVPKFPTSGTLGYLFLACVVGVAMGTMGPGITCRQAKLADIPRLTNATANAIHDGILNVSTVTFSPSVINTSFYGLYTPAGSCDSFLVLSLQTPTGVLLNDTLYVARGMAIQPDAPLAIQADGMLWVQRAPDNWNASAAMAVCDLQQRFPSISLVTQPLLVVGMNGWNDLLSDRTSCADSIHSTVIAYVVVFGLLYVILLFTRVEK